MTELTVGSAYYEINQNLLRRVSDKVSDAAFGGHYTRFEFVGGEPMAIQREALSGPGRLEHVTALLAVQGLTSHVTEHRRAQLVQSDLPSAAIPPEAYTARPTGADVHHSHLIRTRRRIDTQFAQIHDIDGAHSASLAQIKVVDGPVADITRLVSYDTEVVSASTRQTTSSDRALLRRYAGLFGDSGIPRPVLSLLVGTQQSETEIEQLIESATQHPGTDRADDAAGLHRELRDLAMSRMHGNRLDAQVGALTPSTEKLQEIEHTIDALMRE